ncbi:hypothetical protein BH09VER1_BH09VER1_49970 [soil metagenome]
MREPYRKPLILSLPTDTNRSTEPPKLLLTENEMAKRLGCCGRTLRRLRHEGVVPILRLGKLVRYRPDEVLQALLKHAAEQP